MALIRAEISESLLCITISNQNIIERNQNVQFQTYCASQCRDISQKPNFGPNLGSKNFVQPLF